MSLWDLPQNWMWRSIATVAKDTDRRNPQSTPRQPFEYVDIGSIDSREGVIRFDKVKTIEGQNAPSRARKVLLENDVLFATTRPYLRNIAIVLEPLNNQICSTGICVLRAKEGLSEPRYLYFACRSDFFVNQLIPKQRGASYPAVTDSDVFDALIPIPFPDEPERSLMEQRRVVAWIEALLAEVREMRKLHGEITADTDELLQAARREVFGMQPESDWVPLSTYIQFIENGRSPQAQNRPAHDQEWGVLKVGAVTYGYFKSDENKALLPNTKPRAEFEVRQGNFLMSRANTLALVGACALIKETPPPRLLLSDKTFRFHFRDDSKTNPVYLDHVLKSPALRAQIERVASGTSPTMKNISKEKVLNLLVPDYTPDEQARIATHLEKISHEVKEMERINHQHGGLLSTIEQGILAQAFQGDLQGYYD